jgi:hypothetical protein
MKKRWKDLVVSAAPFIAFLQRDTFFDKRFSGNQAGRKVITDADVGMKYATDDSFDVFDDWETVTDSGDVFPPNFQWSSWVSHNLLKNRFFDLESKNFNGADAKWITQGGACLLQELMIRDMKILLNCYSNDYFPEIWRDILDVYLNDGFPCGWDGQYPHGKLVVFTNY